MLAASRAKNTHLITDPSPSQVLLPLGLGTTSPRPDLPLGMSAASISPPPLPVALCASGLEIEPCVKGPWALPAPAGLQALRE